MTVAMRLIPSIDRLLAEATRRGLSYPREEVLAALREAAQACRRLLCAEHEVEDPSEWILNLAQSLLDLLFEPSLCRVINATGVILHTNLGRAILAPEVINAVSKSAAAYSNLELDLTTGERGSRHAHVDKLLCRLTGAEAALVVNNCAAAVLLVLDELARGREVLVSRGELIEIGGAFRLPDVVRASGARLVEVGTTNKTRVSDYEAALGSSSSLLLKSHRSNFHMRGFTEEVDVATLARLGARFGLPVAMDLGSGLLLDLKPYGIDGEPTVQDMVAQGAGIVCFSGDKLLGGPQAGVIVGRRELVARCRKNPLMRALRIDKLTLAGLEATLRLYLSPDTVVSRIPTLRMLTSTDVVLRNRAQELQQRLTVAVGPAARVVVESGTSQMGGGTMADCALATFGVAVTPFRIPIHVWEARLRRMRPAVVCRLWRDALWLDVRTLQAQDSVHLEEAFRKVVQSG